MKSSEIAVLSADMFDNTHDFFWIGPLACIPEKYPLLEQPHRQLFYSLLCIENAQGTAVIDGVSIRLNPPQVICVKPDSVFSIDIHPAATGNIICFTEEFFSLRYNNNALLQFSFLNKECVNDIRLDHNQATEWRTITSFMLQEFHRRHKGVDSVLRSYLNILLCNLDRHFPPGDPVERKNNKEEKLRQFKTLLDEHYVRHKTPSFYAGQLNITTNYLNKLCRTYKGSSSGEMIRKRVTIEAQRLLHYTGLSVAEIAKELEFESASYFVTFFGKNTGMTPENFRKHHQ
ncbi:AraC family transcriptional regulator [Chitinophaga arvensicola]|uniref:AraC-type DNA-binding protein n=1 Tax=Chitinophaga arvensicola TaxID=29529 RepID=A0A1I0RI93_9BACT|nr:AraC family transcriptional regulator [Chitinophaga arvensicola]SEW40580.1 AraC-type DNA-binding protein [Chitinophaga arvensicola]